MSASIRQQFVAPQLTAARTHWVTVVREVLYEVLYAALLGAASWAGSRTRRVGVAAVAITALIIFLVILSLQMADGGGQDVVMQKPCKGPGGGCPI
jgi:hypothetical protein